MMTTMRMAIGDDDSNCDNHKYKDDGNYGDDDIDDVDSIDEILIRNNVYDDENNVDGDW